jgi:hypothetical protein
MAGVAFAVEGDGVGFATESYAASALYTMLASLSGALWRIRRAILYSSPIFGGGHLALLTNGQGFIGPETSFDNGDALAGAGVGLRHQVHADHQAARNDEARSR